MLRSSTSHSSWQTAIAFICRSPSKALSTDAMTIDSKVKRKTLAIGIYPQVSLREARSIRDALLDGRDPALKKQKPDLPSSSDTFEAVARELISKKASGWSEGHTDRTLRRFEVDSFPHLGAMPINSISAAMVLKVLQRMEKRGIADTVLRARENVGAVFRYGISAGRCSNAAPLFRAALV